MAQTIVFLVLAAIILGCGIMAVTTKRIMRAATYLMFVLFGTAGLYFLMGYTFLGSVQVMVIEVTGNFHKSIRRPGHGR